MWYKRPLGGTSRRAPHGVALPCRFKVRGPDYLSNGKKVTSAEPAFALKGVEVVITKKADVLHICPYLPLVMQSSDPFHLPIHFKMPYAGVAQPLQLAARAILYLSASCIVFP
jgi:Protein ENHANCED DISEASE RESISTANCE 2, C-terminal